MDLLRVISHHRARLATPIRTVQKIYGEGDVEKIPFADSVFTHPRPASNRPFLLIEPSYKINGEEKPKPSKDDPVGKTSELSTERSDTSSSSLQTKQDSVKPSTPSASMALEENIVLGVALEGSKRTLPIEEEDTASELKELATSSVSKDNKDDQTPSSVPTDQRKKER